MGFCASRAGRNSVGLLVVILYFCFFIGLQFLAGQSTMPCLMKCNPFYGKLLRSSSSRPFPRLCVPSVALNPISLTNADCVHHAFEEIGLIKKSLPFNQINLPKIKIFYELRQAPPIRGYFEKLRQSIIFQLLKSLFIFVNAKSFET